MDNTRRQILSAFGAMLPVWSIARTSLAADGLLGSAVQSLQAPSPGLLGNRLNQKGTRPKDKPILVEELNMAEQALIKRRYPDLLKEISI